MTKSVRLGDLPQGKGFLVDGVGPYAVAYDVDTHEKKAINLQTFNIVWFPMYLSVEPVTLSVDRKEFIL